jgi:hypothetical protein
MAIASAVAITTVACTQGTQDVRTVGTHARAQGIEGYLVEELEDGTEVVILGPDDAEIARVVARRSGTAETFRVEVEDRTVELAADADGSLRVSETGGATALEANQLSEYGLTLLRMFIAMQADLEIGDASLREVDDDTAYESSEKVCLKHKIQIACALGFCFEVEVELCHTVSHS